MAPAQIGKVRDLAQELNRALDRLKQFKLQTQSNPESYRNERFGHYQRAFFSLQESATPLVAFLMLRELDIEGVRQRLEEEASQALAQTREQATSLIADIESERQRRAKEAKQALAQEVRVVDQAEQYRAQMKQRLDESNRILDAQRAAAADTGVERHAETFQTAADRHKSSAWWWLGLTISAGLGTVGAVLGVVYGLDVQGSISDASVLQLVLAKTVVLAIGLYFTFTAGRIYRANAHLAVIYRHREDSLRTYRAIAEGASDPDTKSKVLLEAAHAIFGQVPTGLAPTKEGGNTVEVLDGAAGRLLRQN